MANRKLDLVDQQEKKRSKLMAIFLEQEIQQSICCLRVCKMNRRMNFIKKFMFFDASIIITKEIYCHFFIHFHRFIFAFDLLFAKYFQTEKNP